MTLAIYLLRFVLLTSGLFLIYAALFLYETEHGLLQNKLEDLWIRIDDRQRPFLSRHTVLIKGLATLLISAFNRLFGSRLLSLRAILVSASFSLAPILVLLSLRTANDHNFDYLSTPCLIWGVAFIVLGAFPLFIRSSLSLRLWILVTSLWHLSTPIFVVYLTSRARLRLGEDAVILDRWPARDGGGCDSAA